MPDESDESATRVKRTYHLVINALHLERSVFMIDISGSEAAMAAEESGGHELPSSEELSPDHVEAMQSRVEQLDLQELGFRIRKETESCYVDREQFGGATCSVPAATAVSEGGEERA